MSRQVVRIGSRASKLALEQAREVVDALRSAWPRLRFEVARIAPEGDRRKGAPLLALGRGTFVKGVEEHLLRGEIDAAIHSAKDMPSTLSDGLEIAAFTERKDPRDVIVNRWGLSLKELPARARLGTSSPRRSGQLLAARPDIEVVPIRGNVDTRLALVGVGGLDGVALAAAGLERLGRIEEVSEFLEADVCVPDAGQGALAVETRSGDAEMGYILAPLNHAPTWASVTAERAFVETLGGGCRVPVAAYAIPSSSALTIHAAACLPNGSRVFRAVVVSPVSSPREAGRKAANALIDAGAEAILYSDMVGEG